jgi:propane monooxygenase large subunit
VQDMKGIEFGSPNVTLNAMSDAEREAFAASYRANPNRTPASV